MLVLIGWQKPMARLVPESHGLHHQSKLARCAADKPSVPTWVAGIAARLLRNKLGTSWDLPHDAKMNTGIVIASHLPSSPRWTYFRHSPFSSLPFPSPLPHASGREEQLAPETDSLPHHYFDLA